MLNRILIVLFLTLCAPAFSDESSTTYSAINDRLDRHEHLIKTISGDRINYRIEKDLLKEAYSSNLQTINMVITFVLGVFAFLGYLGIRDISTIKKEYLLELSKLLSLIHI